MSFSSFITKQEYISRINLDSYQNKTKQNKKKANCSINKNQDDYLSLKVARQTNKQANEGGGDTLSLTSNHAQNPNPRDLQRCSNPYLCSDENPTLSRQWYQVDTFFAQWYQLDTIFFFLFFAKRFFVLIYMLDSFGCDTN